MTVEIVAKVAAAADLAELNKLVTQNEKTIGPLTNIGNEKAFTILAFAVGKSPATYATIAAAKEGKPEVPAGSIAIDTDLVFVKGQLTLCTASRPKPG